MQPTSYGHLHVLALSAIGIDLTTVPLPHLPCAADGKVIDPKSVSVQSGKTYEQEFALQMAKAQVRMLSCWTCMGYPSQRVPVPQAVPCSSSVSGVALQAEAMLRAGGQGQEHALGLLIYSAPRDLARWAAPAAQHAAPRCTCSMHGYSCGDGDLSCCPQC